MRVLFVGDVVGAPGCDALHGLLPGLRQTLALDAVVVNGENAAAGAGITAGLADAMFFAGADVITGGNHIWRHREMAGYLRAERRLLRPANYPHAPGSGAVKIALEDGRTLAVVHVEGRVFMRPLDCPLRAAERELARLGPATASLVDVHAEASSEKQALAYFLDGRASAVVGSHTHVPTADERLLPGGTAYLTDAGMTGPYDSVIGMAPEAAIERLLSQRPCPHRVGSGGVALCAVLVETDDASGRARSIERVRRPWPATDD